MGFKREGRFWVYILECADDTFYTGYTNDLDRRLKRHNEGVASKYTRARLPVRLAWSKEYCRFKTAIKLKRRLSVEDKKQLVSDLRYAPAWIEKVVRRLQE